ncbi:hypothetical protein Tco_0984041 [Tanacetum coccineum]
MSAMANTTLIVTTVTKIATKEKTSKETDAAPKVNILDFCEEHYKDILPVIMDKIRRDNAGTLSARYRNPSKRPKVRDRLKDNDGNLFGRLGHRRQSAFDRLSDTYSPSTTKSGSDRASSRDHSHSRGRPHRWDSSLSRDRPRSRDCSRGIEESYGNTCSSYRTGARYGYHSRDRDRPRIMKRGSISGTLANAYVVPYVQLYPNRDRESVQKKYVKIQWKSIISNRGMERPSRISWSGNPELTKRLNEYVSKTMEEMMTVTTAFIRGETATASIKKGHAPWKPQDQPKRHVFERKSNFREAGKFKPPPLMVTPVEKRSSNKFCDFYNGKGHNTNECMQLKKQIEELVRAGKLSHLIKEIKQGRDQTKVGKKEAPAKDKEITFPPLTSTKGTEGPLVIEAEISGHMIHHMYVDGDSSTESSTSTASTDSDRKSRTKWSQQRHR